MTTPNSAGNRVLKLNVGFLLKEGAGYSREFGFEESESFVAYDVLINSLSGVLRLTRTPQGVLAQGSLHAKTTVSCVRCLHLFEFSYDVELSELFVYRPDVEEVSSKEPYVVNRGGFIDLTPIVREEGILAVPIQALCAPGCKGLCSQCGQDLNEGTCTCTSETLDPRLASLRALLDE